jgi:hypothetical protein
MSVGRIQKQHVFTDLGGGLATHGAPLLIEAGQNKRMLSPALRNVDLFTPGKIAKRRGLSQQGDTLSGSSSVYAEQTTTGTDTQLTWTYGSTPVNQIAIAQKITTVGSLSVSSVTFKLKILPSAYGAQSKLVILNDSSGSPGTSVQGTSPIHRIVLFFLRQ